MNFIENYSIYASGNEAPPDYHRWAAISVLASLVSRKVWIDQGIFTIYPNLYIIFVGMPGNGKSTAMMIAKKMVRAFGNVPIAPDSVTKQAITNLMGGEETKIKKIFEYHGRVIEYTPLSFFANEMTSLLGESPIPTVSFFTAIYDEEVHEVVTKRSGNDMIIGPFINILGCMTPEITTTMLKQNIISGGFNRRCIFVNALKRSKGIPRPVITDEQRAAWNACLAYGKQIQTITGQFTWTKPAEEFFDNWYQEKDKMLQTHTDIVTLGYYTTKDVMLLKVSMLIALSESPDLILKPEHLQQGLAMLNHTEVYLSRVFSGTGRNALVEIKSKLISILETHSPRSVTKKQLMAELFSYGNGNEIAQVFVHCEEIGIIVSGKDNQQREAYQLKK